MAAPILNVHDSVRVEPDAGVLQSLVEDNGELEWDDDVFGVALGRVGVVVSVDDDGTVAVKLQGEEDEVYLPQTALSLAEADTRTPREAALHLDAGHEPSRPSPILSSMRDSFRSHTSHQSIKDAAQNLATTIKSDAKGITRQLVFILLTVSFNGFLVGYALRVFDASRDLINFGKEGEGVFLTDVEKTAMAYVCWSVAAAAAFVGTYVGTHLGRKGPTVVACSLFITGEVMSAGSRNIGTMLFGKVFMGISLGLLTTTTPIYLAELAPSSRRSTYIMFWVTMLACGELAASLLTLKFGDYSPNGGEGWRWLLALVVAPACIHFLMLINVPESPIAMIRNGRVEEATQLVASLYPGSQTALRELEDSVVQNTIGASRSAQGKHKKAVMTGVVLQLLHQALNVRVYSADCQPADSSHHLILRQLGINESSIESENQLDASMDAMVLVVTLTMVIITHFAHRRPLLLVSTAGLCAALIVTGLGARGDHGVVSFAGLLSVYVFFSVGIGCMPWIYSAEGGGSAVAAFWGGLIAMDMVRCPMGMLGDRGVRYLVAAGVALVAFSWVFFKIPASRVSSSEDEALRVRKRREDSNQSLMNATVASDQSPREMEEVTVLSHDLPTPPPEPLFTGLGSAGGGTAASTGRQKRGGFRKKSAQPASGGSIFDGLTVTDTYASYPSTVA